MCYIAGRLISDCGCKPEYKIFLKKNTLIAVLCYATSATQFSHGILIAASELSTRSTFSLKKMFFFDIYICISCFSIDNM